MSCAGESEGRGVVGGGHIAQRHRAIVKVSLARVLAECFNFHIDRSESQLSSSGHKRRLAFGPATMLT